MTEPDTEAVQSRRRQAGVRTAVQDVTQDLPSEVATFERFLARTGGHTGHWDDFDHKTFLRVRGKHKVFDIEAHNTVDNLVPKTH